MPGFVCIDMVKDAVRQHTDDVYESAPWWVVAVLDDYGLWCVYGGSGDTVSRCVAEHADYNEPTQVVAYPFEDGQESNHARTQIENHYRRKTSAQDHDHVVRGGGAVHAGRRRRPLPA